VYEQIETALSNSGCQFFKFNSPTDFLYAITEHPNLEVTQKNPQEQRQRQQQQQMTRPARIDDNEFSHNNTNSNTNDNHNDNDDDDCDYYDKYHNIDDDEVHENVGGNPGHPHVSLCNSTSITKTTITTTTTITTGTNLSTKITNSPTWWSGWFSWTLTHLSRMCGSVVAVGCNIYVIVRIPTFSDLINGVSDMLNGVLNMAYNVCSLTWRD